MKSLRVRAHRVIPNQLTERLATTGTVRANEEVEIVSEISGKISDIFFEEGSRVATGQLLLKIDDSELVVITVNEAGNQLPILAAIGAGEIEVVVVDSVTTSPVDLEADLFVIGPEGPLVEGLS